MKVAKLRFVSVDYSASQPWTLAVYTDPPGFARSLLCTITFPAKSERGVVRFQLPENALTVSIDRLFTPGATGDLAIYDVRWYVRVLGGASGWGWWVDPDIPQTPEAWQTWQFPIEGTSDQFQTWRLPIEGTSDQFQVDDLGIDRRGTEWQWVEVPSGESS